MNPVNALILVIIILFFPPLAVFIIAGCGADLLINIILTLLGFFPGMLHAFYLEFVYYDRGEKSLGGRHTASTAIDLMSQNIQNMNASNTGTGGQDTGTGTGTC